MKALRRIVDNLKPKFEGNKFAHTVFDGLETFLFQPNETTKLGTHIKDGMDLKRTMVHVVIALQFCYIIGTFNIGHQHYVSMNLYNDLFDHWWLKMVYGLFQLLPLFIVTHVVGLGIEFFFAAKKGHAIEEGFLVSGALIPLIMPPDVPLWMVAVATVFAVLVAKEAFGGTGMNILNIALTARVFIFFAYPGDISGDVVWASYDYNFIHKIFGMHTHTMNALGITAADFGEKGWYGIAQLNGWSGATPLGLAATGGWEAVRSATLPNGELMYTPSKMLWGIMPGSIGETTKIGVIIGAVMLLVARIASWRIMLSMLLGAAFTAILFNILGATMYPESLFINVPWYYQFLMGSFFFAMAFMATDPVTASSTPTGKLIYGFMIGMVGMIVRVLNPAYPEGWMLAILFMNVFAPLIDHVVLQQNIKRRVSRVAQ